MVNQFGPDVICAGMYRACSTWQYEVAAHLIEVHCGGRRLGYLVSGEYTELVHDDARKQKAGSQERRGWRVIKAHEGDAAMARELRTGGACASMPIATCAMWCSRSCTSAAKHSSRSCARG